MNGIQQTSIGNKHIRAITSLSRLIWYCCRSFSPAVLWPAMRLSPLPDRMIALIAINIADITLKMIIPTMLQR